jgi:alanyl-tRNA synthetase
MKSTEIRQKFLDFFEKKGHKIVASSSLIPADPTALFTSAGMQQFVPYLSGQAEPPYLRACSCQKCMRSSDIDDVGDTSHQTFFEMLGNWSFGDYFKKEAIDWALELLCSEFGFKKEKLWVTVFKGEKDIPKDKEAIESWKKADIPAERICQFGMEDNFWGPVGTIGPCGPCSEIHYDFGQGEGECDIKGCGPNCACGRFVEVWNLVFMEYNKTGDGKLEPLPAKNIDTGMGLERISAVLQGVKSNFDTDLFKPIIEKIEQLSTTSYKLQATSYRIVADHIRAAAFLIADGVLPGKEDRGYVLRRLIRRAIRHARLITVEDMLKGKFFPELVQTIIETYQNIYPELSKNSEDILIVIQKETEKFTKTLTKGLKQFKKIAKKAISDKHLAISGSDSFHLYDTYGFPLELTKELAQEKGLKVDEKEFKKAFEHHQEISRAGAEKKFGGTGIDMVKDEQARIKITRLHTATHLLHQALRDVLGEHVHQAGSDINPERLRFDFTHSEKLTDDQKKKVEAIVNQKIKENLAVKVEEMAYQKALNSGALAFFKEKYPETVKVYSISPYSKEICAGPHVKSTGELGHFRITSEKSSGAEIRRIKAILE